MYIIASLRLEPSDLSDRTEELESLALDYTDLLQMTLSVWPAISDQSNGGEELKVAIETYLANHAVRRIRSYADMQEVVSIVQVAVNKFHEELRGQLTPLLESIGDDVIVRLSRMLHRDIVLRVELPYNETRA